MLEADARRHIAERGKTSKIPKPCPVCGRNTWEPWARFKSKLGKVINLSWRCARCGHIRDRKDNDGYRPPWEKREQHGKQTAAKA